MSQDSEHDKPADCGSVETRSMTDEEFEESLRRVAENPASQMTQKWLADK